MGVKLTRSLRVPWMILVTAMAYWHRFFFVLVAKSPKQQQQQLTCGEDSSTSTGSLSRSQTPSLATNNTTNNNNSSSSNSSSDHTLLKTSASEQNLAGLNFENDAIDQEDQNEILAQEKTFEKYHPVLVAVSAFFLALKTECIHRPLKAIVTHAFEISSSSEQYPIRREQVIRIELMLMHSLNFHVFQELPWTRAAELLPPVVSSNDDDPNIANEIAKQMLSLFQKVLGYLIQFPFQACYSASAIAECAVWFVADSLEVPQKLDIEKKLTATTESIRQRFSNHIIDHIAYNNRPEGKEIPKIAAKITALRTRMRMQYGAVGGGSSTGNSASASAHHHGGNGSTTSSAMMIPSSNSNNHPQYHHHGGDRRLSALPQQQGNQSYQISPVPTTSTTATTMTNPNNGIANEHNGNSSMMTMMRIRQRDDQQQQILPTRANNPNNGMMPNVPVSIRRPPPAQQQQQQQQ